MVFVLHYDIDASSNATMTALGLDAVGPPYYGKALFWVQVASYRNNSNVYVSPLACYATIMAFLTILRQIVFTKVFPLCNMNSHEGGLRGAVGQLEHEWVGPNNSDRQRFKRCYYLRSSQRLGLAEMRVDTPL